MPTLTRHAPACCVLLVMSLAVSGCGIGFKNLRQADGQLAPCDGGPHCVSSLEQDPDRRVEPLLYSGEREAAQRKLIEVLKGLKRSTVVASSPDYVHAEVSTAIMGYVDDVELVFSAKDKRVDVRSSSRIGYYDFGVNRDRVEAIRAAFKGA